MILIIYVCIYDRISVFSPMKTYCILHFFASWSAFHSFGFINGMLGVTHKLIFHHLKNHSTIELKLKIHFLCKFIHGVGMRFVCNTWDSAPYNSYGTIFWPIRIWIFFFSFCIDFKLKFHLAHASCKMHTFRWTK